MKRIVPYLLLCTLCLAGLGAAFAASPETDPSEWPDVPFARNMASGKIIYLGMDKDEAEAITGAPLEALRSGNNIYDYEDIILGFREDRLVYIQIPDKKPVWAANSVVTPFMPLDQALLALGMSYEMRGTLSSYAYYGLLYLDDGTQTQFDPDLRMMYQWQLSFGTHGETVEMIMMGDRQYLTDRR